MKRLYIVRHGQTQWNVEQRMQGRLDSALTPAGQAQAISHGELLSSLGGVDQLFVSPSGRTQETAYLLNSFLGATLTFDDVLMERDCGSWGGLTIDEIKAQFPKDWEARQLDPYAHRPPGGENTADMITRVCGFLDEMHSIAAERVAIVTHAVMSRAILTHLLGLAPALAGRIRHPNNALYQLDVSAGDIQACHYVDGAGPHAGLLHGPVSADPQPIR